MTCVQMQRVEKPKVAPRNKSKKFKNLKIDFDELVELVQAEVDENPEIMHISKQRNREQSAD